LTAIIRSKQNAFSPQTTLSKLSFYLPKINAATETAKMCKSLKDWFTGKNKCFDAVSLVAGRASGL